MGRKKTPGLFKRGEIWHIDKVFCVGDKKRHIRGTTGCRKIDEAEEVLAQTMQSTRGELLYGPPNQARTFSEAAVEYALALEERGSDPKRGVLDITSLDPFIGHLPLSHVHQKALEP